MRCRRISRGVAEGSALVSKEPISFFGGIDPETGRVIERGHPLFGETVTDKILVFPTGKGSTVGSYILYQLAKAGKAPKGIICREAEPIVAVGAIIAGIPMVDKPESFNFKDGQWIRIDGDKGEIEILEGCGEG